MADEIEFSGEIISSGFGWPAEKDVLSWHMPDTRPDVVMVNIKGKIKWCEYIKMGSDWVYFDMTGATLAEGKN